MTAAVASLDRPGTASSEARAPVCPHLGPTVCALAAAALLLAGVRLYVGPQLPGRLPFYAAHAMSFKVNGNVVQRVAFRTPDELPVYGSSELDFWADNRADAFFRDRPSGFAVFPVGRGGTTCLVILQKLAAVGDVARGKKVVIFLSPVWFLDHSVDGRALNANLGITQLSAWLFSDALSPGLKRDIARRLREVSSELKDQQLIADTAECLAEPTLWNRLRLALLYPLGKLQNTLLERLDYCVLFWEMIFPQPRWQPIGREPDIPRAPGGGIDWDQLAARAEAAGDDAVDRRPIPPRDPVGDFTSRLQASREFDDLALLLRVVRELKMRACFISQPFNAARSDAEGIAAPTRRAYYERLRALLQPSGYPWQDFADHEDDRSFFNDTSHPTAKAWIFYDREIDRFRAGPD